MDLPLFPWDCRRAERVVFRGLCLQRPTEMLWGLSGQAPRCASQPCFRHASPLHCSHVLAFAQDVFQASEAPRQCAGLQIRTAQVYPHKMSSATALRNKEALDGSVRACVSTFLRYDFSISCMCLHLQTMWKTEKTSMCRAHKNSQAFREGRFGKQLCHSNIWNWWHSWMWVMWHWLGMGR